MMKTAKDLELSLLLKEKQIQDLKLEKIHLIENGLILRKRIDKTIEYIDKHAYSNVINGYDELYNGQIEKLLEILKGEQNEN